MSPDYEPQLAVPEGHETGTSNTLWTPTGVKYLQSWAVGVEQESGERVWKHEFQLSYMGEISNFGVLAEESASEKQIEDMAAETSESTAKKIKVKLEQRAGRLRPEDLASRKNWDARRDLAGAWRQYRSWRNGS